MVTFKDGTVKAQMVCTAATPDTIEATDIRTFVSHGQRLIRDHRPQLTLYHGGERATLEVARLARNSSSKVVATAWEFGWESRTAFELAHLVVAGSKYLANHYGQRIGLKALGYPPPVDFPPPAAPPSGTTALITETLPEHAAPVLLALKERGFSGGIRLEGSNNLWERFLPAGVEQYQFVAPSEGRRALWNGVRVGVAISVEGSGRAGAEALCHGVPLIADKNSPNEETSSGYGRFLEASPENGVAWADAVASVLLDKPDFEKSQRDAARLYAPEIQRSGYLRLLEGMIR